MPELDSERSRERKRQLREREQRAEAVGAPMPFNPETLQRQGDLLQEQTKADSTAAALQPQAGAD
eukprot:4060720-Alexandrium_andersonii.AAC.1